MRLFVALVLLALSACSVAQPDGAHAEAAPKEPIAVEQRIIPIALAGPIASRDAEISGLAWYGDTLVLLPQYPARFEVGVDTVNVQNERGDRGAVFAIPRSEIEAYLAAASPAPLRPRAVPFEAPDVADRILSFEGYEAITFLGDEVFLAVEFEDEVDIQGYLVAGTVAPGLGHIQLDSSTLRPLPAQTRIGNLSYETLLIVPGGVMALQEANGKAVNPRPEAYVFDAALKMRDSLDFQNLEYRLTDATDIDTTGRFWALNYFYPGEREILQPAVDSVALDYGVGPTHRRLPQVERLVEMRYAAGHIVRTERPPVQLVLAGDRPRNWEGVVRLGDRGFLVATDKFPETILAFVPLPPAPRADGE